MTDLAIDVIAKAIDPNAFSEEIRPGGDMFISVRQNNARIIAERVVAALADEDTSHEL